VKIAKMLNLLQLKTKMFSSSPSIAQFRGALPCCAMHCSFYILCQC